MTTQTLEPKVESTEAPEDELKAAKAKVEVAAEPAAEEASEEKEKEEEQQKVSQRASAFPSVSVPLHTPTPLPIARSCPFLSLHLCLHSPATRSESRRSQT